MKLRKPTSVIARASRPAVAGALLVAGLLSGAASAATPSTSVGNGTGSGFIGGLSAVSKVASTVPSLGKGSPGNGDVNPYGVAVVPTSTGKLVAGDVLVSNFNDAANNQGTGVTVMQNLPDWEGQRFLERGPTGKRACRLDHSFVRIPQR